MKKLFKFIGSVAAIGAAVIGGVAVYKKFFAPKDEFDEMDEELEDDLENETKDGERGYVSLSSVEEKAEEVAEDVKEAVEDVTEDVKEAAEDIADAAEEVKEDIAE